MDPCRDRWLTHISIDFIFLLIIMSQIKLIGYNTATALSYFFEFCFYVVLCCSLLCYMYCVMYAMLCYIMTWYHVAQSDLELLTLSTS